MKSTISQIEPDLLLEAWIRAWTASRHTPSAIKLENGGFKVHVGLPGHVVRYVLPGSNLAEVASIADRVVEPGSWLKVAAPPDIVNTLLPERWSVQATEYLMGTALLPAAATEMPVGYQLSMQTEAMAATVTLTHVSGGLAAVGRIAFWDTFTVFDQIVTEPAHRRKGLGSIVMDALRNHAVSRGVLNGVLVATEEGSHLYRALGWYLSTPMTAAVIPVSAAASAP